MTSDNETYYIYSLTLSNEADEILEKKNYKYYEIDAMYKMIISAKSEDEARAIAYQTLSQSYLDNTYDFWCPKDLDLQKKYIVCNKIGFSLREESYVICTSGQYSTG
jgi:hypothetical protein